jgi:UDP-GlcNAc:undecaprenyl-phosphate/decaprenyl-phosphate GlcNAc-1-phosphate transferase
LAFYFCNISMQKIAGIIMASSVMLAFGIIDDKYELSISKKFILQIIATLLVISFGIRTSIGYISASLNILITMIWIIGITNAFNHLDIIDGLAGVISLIIGFAFLSVCLVKSEVDVSILILSLVGAVGGFMIFNKPPAKVYMGNSGSHFIGFILAVTVLVISYTSPGRSTAVFAPLLILGLPIFDTFFLIFRRISLSKSPFQKSDDHFTYSLFKLGYSKMQTMFLMSGLAALFSLSGVLLTNADIFWGIIIVIAVILFGIFMAVLPHILRAER